MQIRQPPMPVRFLGDPTHPTVLSYKAIEIR